MRVIIMRPGKPDELKEVTDNLRDYTRLKMYVTPLLDGAGMERVRVLASISGEPPYVVTDMIVDEKSAVNGLPRNEPATLIYRRATMMGRTGQRPPANAEALPAIYGPAILFEERVWF